MKIISLSVCNDKIGVAAVETAVTSISSLTTVRVAIPLGTLEINGSELQKITNIMRYLKTNIVIIGLPRGGGERVRYVRAFAELLMTLDAKVRFQDEALSGVLARKSLKRENRGKNSKKKHTEADVRKKAAALILQDFVDGIGRSEVEIKPQFQLESQSLLSDGLKLEPTPIEECEVVVESPIVVEAVAEAEPIPAVPVVDVVEVLPIKPPRVFRKIDIINIR